MEDCLFCKIIKGEIPCDKVYEDEEILAFYDIHPFVFQTPQSSASSPHFLPSEGLKDRFYS